MYSVLRLFFFQDCLQCADSGERFRQFNELKLIHPINCFTARQSYVFFEKEALIVLLKKCLKVLVALAQQWEALTALLKRLID